MKKMNKKGFTLIEMLAVIAIIAVLVAIIVPAVSNSTKKAQAAADAANLRSIQAEAAIDYLEDKDLDKIYTVAIKSVTGAVEIHLVDDKLVAVVNVTTAGTGYTAGYYDVNSFAAVAANGGTIAPNTTAGYADGNKLAYPAA